jgi:hypothetical protein
MSKAEEADLTSRQHLVRLLLEQVERTFSTEGSQKAMQDLANLLRRLDERTLRALLQAQGVADEDELTEASP